MKPYHEWEAEREVYCGRCGLAFESLYEYKNITTRTVVDPATKTDEDSMTGCPRCGYENSWMTTFDVKFAFDDEHSSFCFGADGIGALREEQKDRGGKLDEGWNWVGTGEWVKELILLARAFELTARGEKPKMREYEIILTRVTLRFYEMESLEEFVTKHTERETR